MASFCLAGKYYDSATGVGFGIAASKGITGGRKGYKAALFEGGICVPFIARWPGKIPAGSVCPEPAMTIDLLAGQIDAAINPGNSGGPVIVDGKIVGVVMQANSGGRAENLGYFVPPDIINHVLTDAEDGVYDGFPDLGFRTQDLESPAAKEAYGLTPEQSGVLVIKVFEGSPAAGILQENDVVMKIAGFAVAGDSTIAVNEALQTNFKYAIDLQQIGDEIEIEYARNGEVLTENLVASKRQESYGLVKPEAFDEIPEYYVYGGVLFVPLNMNLIMRWGPDCNRTAPVNLLQARDEWASPERSELVVALQVLAADVNLGYHDLRNWVVDTVNGQPVRDFHHFTQMLRDNATRLFRSEGGATYSPMETVDFSTFLPDYGFIGVAIEVAPDTIDEVQSKIQGIATDLATTPVPESEIKRIVAPKLEQYRRAVTTSVGYWMEMLGNAHDGGAGLEYIRTEGTDYATITPADIQAAAKKWLKPETAWKLKVVPE